MAERYYAGIVLGWSMMIGGCIGVIASLIVRSGKLFTFCAAIAAIGYLIKNHHIM